MPQDSSGLDKDYHTLKIAFLFYLKVLNAAVVGRFGACFLYLKDPGKKLLRRIGMDSVVFKLKHIA